jgi:hypothetical protein
MSFIAHKALSDPPLRPLRILYDAIVKDSLPSAREGGSIAIVAMGFFRNLGNLGKRKKSKAKQVANATVTTPGR